MTVTNYDEWVADGKPWRNAPAIAMFRELLVGYGFTVYTIGNQDHLTAAVPEDHTPYSHTAWPAGQPYPTVLALDIMPGGRVDWRRLGETIVVDKAMGKPGTEWIKYVNYTTTDGRCIHVSWEPNVASRVSDDTGHVHISCRSDLFKQTDFEGWNPVAELLTDPAITPVSTPVSTPVPAGDTTTEDIMGKLPYLQYGAKGQAVCDAQGLLIAHGYPVGSSDGRPDGDWGRVTDSSVRQFQVDRKVTNSVTASGHGDGKLGPHTWAALLDVTA